VPTEFESEFKSLWMQSEEDRSTTQKQDSERDIALYDAGMILPHHVAGRLLRDQVYPDLDAGWVKELEMASEGIDRPGEEPEPAPPAPPIEDPVEEQGEPDDPEQAEDT
jgi:hypothetical protein